MKGKNKLIYVVGILLVIIIILLTYIIYDKFYINEVNNIIVNNTENNSNIDNTASDMNNTNVLVSINEDEAYSLFNLFINAGGDNMSNNSISPMEYDKNIITLNDLSNEEMFGILKKSLKQNDIVIISTDGGDYGMGQYKVYKETFENYSLKYLGIEIKLPNSYFDFSANCELNNDAYICTNVPTGAESTSKWIYFPVSYTLEDNKLHIIGKAVYLKIELDNGDGYYIDENLNNKICNYSDNIYCIIDNINKLHSINLTLDLTNNNYIFEQIETK